MDRWWRVVVVALACLAPEGFVEAGLTPTKASQLATVTTVLSCPILGYAKAAALDHVVKADGSGGPLVIPPKQVLVLNDVSASTIGQAPGDVFGVQVVVGTSVQSDVVDTVFEVASAGGHLAVHFTAPTGIAVKPGNAVCIALINFTHPSAIVGIATTGHGFFAPDK